MERTCHARLRKARLLAVCWQRARIPDPLHAMQFRPPPPSQVRAVGPANRPSRSNRGCPLDTAGDRCLWHAGGMGGENDVARTWRRRLLARPEGEATPSVTIASWASREGGAAASSGSTSSRMAAVLCSSAIQGSAGGHGKVISMQ
jgi:hypothetical protein